MRWVACVAFCACATSQPVEQPPTQKDPAVVDAFMNALLSHKEEIKACAREQQRRDPSVTGKLVMSWKFTPGGSPAKIAVVSAPEDSSYFADCISQALVTWVFPPQAVTDELVVFPFKF